MAQNSHVKIGACPWKHARNHAETTKMQEKSSANKVTFQS